jgi:hypothetical protein
MFWNLVQYEVCPWMHGSLTGTQAVYLTGCLCVDLELEGDLSMAFENFFVLFFFFFFFLVVTLLLDCYCKNGLRICSINRKFSPSTVKKKKPIENLFYEWFECLLWRSLCWGEMLLKPICSSILIVFLMGFWFLFLFLFGHIAWGCMGETFS